MVPRSFFLVRLLFISINQPYGLAWNTFVMSWANASSCYPDMLDKLQKRISRTVGPSRITSLEPLAHRQNVISSIISDIWYHFGRCLSKLVVLVALPPSHVRYTHYSNSFHFFFTILRCRLWDAYVNSFFPLTARLRILYPQNAFL